MYRILITSRNFGAISAKDFDYFTSKGYEIAENPYFGSLPNEEQLISLVKDVDAAHIGNDRFNARVLESAPRLKAVNKAGIGVDNIDIEVASNLGIAVTNVPTATANSVADLTMGMILALFKKIVYTCNRVKQQNMWPLDRGTDMAGKTIGIIGLGRIGKKVVQRALGFDMKVLVYELFPDAEFVHRYGLELVDVDELVSLSDVVTLHIPKTPESTNFIDAARIASMKPTAILVNCARGGLVDEDALYKALSSGKLAGAGFDVLAEEPPPKRPPLFDLENFIITSHSGGNSTEAILETSKVAAENIISILEEGGDSCPNFLNRDRIENMRARLK
jgi:D-3-phosphoglycerate dehydrogenase